jgi:hypothetical protein
MIVREMENEWTCDLLLLVAVEVMVAGGYLENVLAAADSAAWAYRLAQEAVEPIIKAL